MQHGSATPTTVDDGSGRMPRLWCIGRGIPAPVTGVRSRENTPKRSPRSVVFTVPAWLGMPL